MKRAEVEKALATMSVVRQCGLLELLRSTFYYRPVGEDAYSLTLMRRIDEQFTKRPFYGVPRFVYLIAILDWYSRYVVSWKLSTTLDTGFCLGALWLSAFKMDKMVTRGRLLIYLQEAPQLSKEWGEGQSFFGGDDLSTPCRQVMPGTEFPMLRSTGDETETQRQGHENENEP